MITCVCPGCGRRLNAQDELAGKRARCPRCRKPVLLPAVSPTRALLPSGDTHPDVPRAPWPPATRPVLSGYELLEELGRGGMGVVYKARQSKLNRIVAVKTLSLGPQDDPGRLARFEREARLVAQLQHPNIVTAYDFISDGNQLVLVMELLEGETVEARVRRRPGALDERTAWGLVRQAAAGLAHAARLGIIHRDVNPSNLFLIEAPQGALLPPGLPMVKLMDFGLALLAETSDGHRLTQAGMVLGTPAYMAPEQFSGGKIDVHADVYGLGATAWYLLSGEPPFTGSNVWEVMVKKTSQTGPASALPATVSAESRRLLLDMLAQDAGQRIGSYPELLHRIDQLGLDSSSRPLEFQALRRRARQAFSTAFASAQRPGPLRRCALGLGILLTLGLSANLIAGKFRHTGPAQQTEAQPSEEPALVRSGWVSPLFDGISLTGWAAREGAWAPGQDAEGGKVLRGRGVLRRQYPPLELYRIGLNVDLHEASAVEIHFGLRQGKEGARPHVLRLTRTGMLVGRRGGDRDQLEVTSAERPLPRPGQVGTAPRYLEVQIERHHTRWLVRVDGQQLGSSAVASGELPELRLVAEGGDALFEALEIAQLLPSR
jgi:serine/threonine-protein kinase